MEKTAKVLWSIDDWIVMSAINEMRRDYHLSPFIFDSGYEELDRVMLAEALGLPRDSTIEEVEKARLARLKKVL